MAFRAMDRHGLRPRDDEGILVLSTPLTVLSQARRCLMLEVMREPRTINALSQRLHRNRSAVTKDVGLLEKVGLTKSKPKAS